MNEAFRFSIDRGGTFTDIYAELPGEHGYRVMKLLSEDPSYEDAPREGIRRIMSEYLERSLSSRNIPAQDIEWIRMGTTVATNALLERSGARTALVISQGFGDALQIGNQTRQKIFDLEIRKFDQLYEIVIEADERIRIVRPEEEEVQGRVIQGITGERFEVLKELDLEGLRPLLQQAYNRGIRSIAVVFMHAHAWPEHEKAAGRLAREIGFTQISLSSQVMPKAKLVARGDTTLVDAYLNPKIQDYLQSFRSGFTDQLSGTELLFMQSDGGLVQASDFNGSRAILSGPAGGVVGYATTTYAQMGNKPVIGFDMGGTSTDVSRYGGVFELVHETETADVRIQAPQLHIKTVAAGGGSRLFFDNGMLLVGPESAGAHPGPVCYRKGGHLSLTDANLVLGRIQPRYFPHIFGPNNDLPLDTQGSWEAMRELTTSINSYYADRGKEPLSVEEVAMGFIEVANEVMVRPIREISVMRGFDIKDHILATFGGAGPQHACSIAKALGIREIFIHRFSGILSAYGMGLADVVTERHRPSASEYTLQDHDTFIAELKELQRDAEAEIAEQGFSSENIHSTLYLNMRYEGTDTSLMVPRPEDGDFHRAFRQTYTREFGFDLEGRSVLVDDLRVRSVGITSSVSQQAVQPAEGPAVPVDEVCCYFGGSWEEVPVYNLEAMKANHQVQGPALIIQDTSTIVIEPDCSLRISQFGDMAIKVGQWGGKNVDREVDPVQLSIFSNLFMSIAEQMGRTLQKTAISTNIKERLDFSCALFGPEGQLVANAPHMPVHLGAMSEAVKAQMLLHKDRLQPGDVLVSNHPKAGGSHLPDITVMTPVFRKDDIIFWVANRGHHAEVGGISPGSMPPNSRTIHEEGACIESYKLVEEGIFQEEGIRQLLLAPGRIRPEPGRPAISGTRCLSDNISDLKAQTAANQKGIDLVMEMVEHYGLDVVHAYMNHVQYAAEEAVRNSLKELSLHKGLDAIGAIEAVDYLDDGSQLVLHLSIDREKGSAIFDFEGTGYELWGNLNAPLAVTKSAVLYCLRCLVTKDIPLNDGCLLPIEFKVPRGSLLDPSPEAAVVGGNVLTSQRVADVVFKAFGVAAASQGCMNNFTFGNERFGYYETVGGGAGAGPSWHGQTGVHTHMSNTRITDPEILERRFPLLLREFSIRRNTGGTGRFRGGDGLVREIEFLEPLNAAILSERRSFQPYGLQGGGPGARGINLFITKDGRTLNLGGKNEIRAQPGDRIRILSPGGGGFGSPGGNAFGQ